MGKNRDEGGPGKISSLMGYLPTSLRYGTPHSDSRTPVRNKVIAAVVATGAFAAVGQSFIDDGSDSPENNVKSMAAQQPMQASVNKAQEAPASIELRGAQPAEAPAPAPQSPESDEGGASAADQDSGKTQAEKAQAAKDAQRKKEAQRKAVQEQIRLKKAFAQKAAEQAAERKAAAQKAAEQAAKQAAEKKAAAAAPKPKAASAESGGKLVDSGRLTSGYHTRGGSHAGIDIGADMGTPIHAPSGGEVISSGPASGFGLWVRIKHDDGKVTVYGHINQSQVSVGEHVEAGQQIATVGSRGQSTGPHLHFEVRHGAGGQETNPIPWLKNQGFSLA
ncbi:M23 family metallopeptidase [Haloactinomyces albus]|uniref:Murein DD-endopeptidase MepM/ murein hydrolase activator NlpD n=1 Tax=Haloactinomyces albus TaxID=1352928 RepID=A0AAE3Z8T7_9ACTN|nr:M23 family metallopeptidase [Haloactinomyces albus]MDR7300467.1 murein DD-endopeptidase MepM/ murein hydrolase activator NlpD [Haloactinomyces albus]